MKAIEQSDVILHARTAKMSDRVGKDVEIPELWPDAYFAVGFDCCEGRCVFGNDVFYDMEKFLSLIDAEKYLESHRFRTGSWFAIATEVILVLPAFFKNGMDLLVSSPSFGPSLHQLHSRRHDQSYLEIFRSISDANKTKKYWPSSHCFSANLDVRLFYHEEYKMIVEGSKIHTLSKTTQSIDGRVSKQLTDYSVLKFSEIQSPKKQ